MKAVLIYVSLQGCPACERFNPEWNKLVEKYTNSQIMTVKRSPSRNTPHALTKYEWWYPTVILVSYEEYMIMFDVNKMENAEHVPVNKEYDATVAHYNAGSEYKKSMGMAYSAEAIGVWVSDSMLSLDKQTASIMSYGTFKRLTKS